MAKNYHIQIPDKLSEFIDSKRNGKSYAATIKHLLTEIQKREEQTTTNPTKEGTYETNDTYQPNSK